MNSGPRIQCATCLDILQSKHRHDWVCCTCFSDTQGKEGIYVDGGGDYLRLGGNPFVMVYLDEKEEE